MCDSLTVLCFMITSLFYNFTVSDTPTDLSLTKLCTGLLHVQLSWTGSSPRYEVFYSLSGSDDIQSLVETTDTTYSATSGLMQDETYELFVVMMVLLYYPVLIVVLRV